jgi:glycine hydroxymethyltransferase
LDNRARGLIYSRLLQEPFKESVDLITSSTHKTFQGSQGGIIIGSSGLSEQDWKKIDLSVFPGTLSNTHIHRFPSLAVTALEMNEYGEEYASQVVKNAKAFGKALYDWDLKALCPNLGFTESHQFIVDVNEHGGGQKVARMMAQYSARREVIDFCLLI